MLAPHQQADDHRSAERNCVRGRNRFPMKRGGTLDRFERTRMLPPLTATEMSSAGRVESVDTGTF